MSQQENVTRVKEQHKQALLDKPNVVGVGRGYKVSGGQTTDEESVVILVRQKLPPAALSPAALVPRTLDGVRTDVVQVGDLRALQSPTDRWRPAPGGVSIGHYLITAGTFGAVVRDRTTGERLILSNNHVLANSNDAALGDPILQPGPVDGGQQTSDTIARLLRFVPIQFNVEPGQCSIAEAAAGLLNLLARALQSQHRLQTLQVIPQATNLVDAAVARPLDDADISDEIREIGVVTGTTSAFLGMAVRKSGRSTGFTTGTITVMDATVSVSYGTGRTAQFENQIVSTPMSAPGDSGSLLVTGDALHAVALLFAGSDEATIFCPIQAVLDSLDVTI
jgi:hypothetical protein